MDAGGTDETDGGEEPVDAGPPPPWTVTGTQVKDASGARDLRQGSGAFTLEVDGTGLGLADTFALEGFTTTVSAKTDTAVMLVGTVAHGAARGGRALTLSGAGFTQVLKGAAVITGVSAARSAGASDTTGRGTPSSPYATLKHALLIAKAGDTVSLGAGTYNPASGETWPGIESSPTTPTLTPNIPAGVMVEGAGDATILAASKPDAGETGLVFDGDGGVSSLHMQNFHRAVLVEKNGNVLVDHVSVQGGANDAVLAAQGGRVTVNACDLYGSRASGLAGFPATLTVTGTKMRGNRTGLFVSASAATVSDSSLTDNGVGTDPYRAGLWVQSTAVVKSLRNTFARNATAGVEYQGTSKSSVALDGDTFENNTTDVDAVNPASLKARRVKTSGSTTAFFLLGGGQFDLGTAADPGSNTLSAHGSVVHLAGNASGARMDASHTTFNGVTPVAQTLKGPIHSTGWWLESSSDVLTLH